MTTTNFIPQEALATDSFRLAALRLLSKIETGGGGGIPWTNGTATVSYSAVSNSSTIAAGAYAISIANVGNAAGTVAGVSLPAGGVVEFEAFQDEVNRVQKLLPSIAYVATGTTFNILVES